MKIILDCGDLGEQEAEIEYTYTPGTPDVMYMPNGDPGYPGDPPEFEITSLKVFGVEIPTHMLSDQALDMIYDDVCAWEAENVYGEEY